MTYLWNSDDLKAATNGSVTKDFKITGIEFDSRKVKKGDMFIALKGFHIDGHEFVESAISAGAEAAMVNKTYHNQSLPLLLVDDTYEALDKMAAYNRKRTNAYYMAVTGSVGKTSTKEMLRHIFSNFGKTHASAGNFNNRLGLPISLARMDPNSKYAIFELGMNHAGELRELVKSVVPSLAIITTIEPAHLEFFGTVENIAKAKAEIFESMDKNSIAILNIDNPYHHILEAAAKANNVEKILSFGESKHANGRLLSYEFEFGVSTITANILGEEIKYTLNLAGKHQAINSLSVLLAAKMAGLPVKEAASYLSSFSAVAGRGQVLEIEKNGVKFTLIDDCYNAGPASVAAALNSLGARKTSGKKIAILGDMLELGTESANLHKKLLHEIVANEVDGIIAVGSIMKELYDILPAARQIAHYKNVDQLLPEFIKHINSGDLVLVKGSRGVGLRKLVEECTS